MRTFNHIKTVTLLICGGLAFSSLAFSASNGTKASSMVHQQGNASSANGHTKSTSGEQGNNSTIKLSDEAITKSVGEVLAPYAGKVTFKVTNGIVYLAGQLDSDTNYEKLVTLVESTNGISDVNVDELTVKDSTQPMQDTYITGKVKGSLIRNNVMGKDVPAWSVSVETKNGQVYLSGEVASDTEKQNVIRIVKAVKGVTKIDDKLEISKKDSSGDNHNTSSNPAVKTESTTTNH